MAPADRHPDVEVLAEYVDRTLPPDIRTGVDRHLAVCADCRSIVMTASEFAHYDVSQEDPAPPARPMGPQRWLMSVAAVAATVVLAMILRGAAPFRIGLEQRSANVEMQTLVDAVAKEATRPIEGRLSGFEYGSPPAVRRGESDLELMTPTRAAAAAAIEKGRDRPSAEGHVTRGVAYLVLGQWDRATAALEAAARAGPAGADVLNDLAASYIARGVALGGTHDFDSAVAATDRAIAAAPSMREAHYNRALALTYLGRTPEAHDAWIRYRQIESDPAWLADAARFESRESLAPRP